MTTSHIYIYDTLYIMFTTTFPMFLTQLISPTFPTSPMFPTSSRNSFVTNLTYICSAPLLVTK